MSIEQNGFRKHHGTPDTIFKIISDITDGFNRKENTVAIFIDFKKAFDTLDFKILFKKLQKLNLSQNLYFWFENYLTNRKQLTFMNNVKSNVSPITHGVPQGSILGPILFNLYINDLYSMVSNKLLLYADDSVIYATSVSLTHLYNSLQEDLNQVALWCNYHKLTIKIKKKKLMCFNLQSIQDSLMYQIHLGNYIIDTVAVFKYLGIQLDSKLSFNCQYNETYKLASYKLFLLRRIRNYITEFTALTVVKSMLLPYLDMGNLYFSAIPQRELGKLDTVLNSALRSVYNVRNPRDVHTVDLYVKANLFSLSYRRKYYLLNLIHRLICTGSINLDQVNRVTRMNRAPLLKTTVASKQTIANSTVFIARDLWNSLSTEMRLIDSHEVFKNLIKKDINTEYVQEEMLKLTAGMFI